MPFVRVAVKVHVVLLVPAEFTAAVIEAVVIVPVTSSKDVVPVENFVVSRMEFEELST